jgi:hypothetical protein
MRWIWSVIVWLWTNHWQLWFWMVSIRSFTDLKKMKLEMKDVLRLAQCWDVIQRCHYCSWQVRYRIAYPRKQDRKERSGKSLKWAERKQRFAHFVSSRCGFDIVHIRQWDWWWWCNLSCRRFDIQQYVGIIESREYRSSSISNLDTGIADGGAVTIHFALQHNTTLKSLNLVSKCVNYMLTF